MEKETIMIDGVRYYADRPRSCRGCFFWKNRKVGCTLKKENCYYHPDFKYRRCLYAKCPYGKPDNEVFRQKPLRTDCVTGREVVR